MIYDYSGNILSEIDTEEGAIFASINLYDMYNFREQCTILNDICEDYSVLCK